MIQKIIPAIKAKWPDRNQKILIQQDDASSHIDEDDPDFVAVGVTGVWNMRLMTQSPKLQDLNALDLSFFRALQSKQWSNGWFLETMDDLIETVLMTFDEFEPTILNFGWWTLIGYKYYDDVIKTTEITTMNSDTWERTRLFAMECFRKFLFLQMMC